MGIYAGLLGEVAKVKLNQQASERGGGPKWLHFRATSAPKSPLAIILLQTQT